MTTVGPPPCFWNTNNSCARCICVFFLFFFISVWFGLKFGFLAFLSPCLLKQGMFLLVENVVDPHVPTVQKMISVVPARSVSLYVAPYEMPLLEDVYINPGSSCVRLSINHIQPGQMTVSDASPHSALKSGQDTWMNPFLMQRFVFLKWLFLNAWLK